jgi:hypothetical protein
MKRWCVSSELDVFLQAVARHSHQAEGPEKKETCYGFLAYLLAT